MNVGKKSLEILVLANYFNENQMNTSENEVVTARVTVPSRIHGPGNHKMLIAKSRCGRWDHVSRGATKKQEQYYQL